MDRFHTIHFIEGKPQDGYMWSGGRGTKRQATSRPDHLWPEIWRSLSRKSKVKGKQIFASGKPQLENARMLPGIYFIEPEDTEFKEIIKNARKKLEVPAAPAMPCKIKNRRHGATRSKNDDHKSKFASMLGAEESKRQRMEIIAFQSHEDHIAGKASNESTATL